MKLLITGGAGFVGTNLVADLCDRDDFEITVFDNETLGHRDNIASFPVHFIHGDIRDRAALADAMAGHDAIIHLAADTRVMDSITDPSFNFDNNVAATFQLLELAREQGVRRVINASTGGAILGEAPSPVHENMPARPLSPYGAAKLAVEGYMNAFGACYGLQTCSLRFSNIYGPRSYHKGSVVAYFIRRLLAGQGLTVYGDGEQVRDYLYVGDLTTGIRQALIQGASGTYQLGTGKPTSLRELIEIIAEVTGKRPQVTYEPARSGEIHKTYCDISKASRELGFAPRTDLAQGIRETWRWFLAQTGPSKTTSETENK